MLTFVAELWSTNVPGVGPLAKCLRLLYYYCFCRSLPHPSDSNNMPPRNLWHTYDIRPWAATAWGWVPNNKTWYSAHVPTSHRYRQSIYCLFRKCAYDDLFHSDVDYVSDAKVPVVTPPTSGTLIFATVGCCFVIHLTMQHILNGVQCYLRLYIKILAYRARNRNIHLVASRS